MLEIPDKIYSRARRAFENQYRDVRFEKLNTTANGTGNFSDIYKMTCSSGVYCVKVLSTDYTYFKDEYGRKVRVPSHELRKNHIREILCLRYMEDVNRLLEDEDKYICACELKDAYQFLPDEKNEPGNAIYFLVMEMYEETVFRYFENHEVTERMARQFAIDTLRALTYLHTPFDIREFVDKYGKGLKIPEEVLYDFGYYNENPEERQRLIIHRDIKKENSFIWKDLGGTVHFLLGDFGAVTYMHPTHPHGTLIVTSLKREELMEEMRSAINSCNRTFAYKPDSDIYNLGWVLRNISKSGSCKDLSFTPGFSEIIYKTIPKDRYQTAQEMLKAIEDLEKEELDDNVQDTPIPEYNAVQCRLLILDNLLEKAESVAAGGKDTSYACGLLYAFLQAKKGTEEDNRRALELTEKLLQQDSRNVSANLLFYLIFRFGDKAGYTHAKKKKSTAEHCLEFAARSGVAFAEYIYTDICLEAMSAAPKKQEKEKWRKELIWNLDSAVAAGFAPAIAFKCDILKYAEENPAEFDAIYTEEDIDAETREAFLCFNEDVSMKKNPVDLEWFITECL